MSDSSDMMATADPAAGRFYHVLMHHRLLKALRRRTPLWRLELQKTMERLQFGYWDNGTRVKLLKGASKLVYEARVTLSQRLLFTVATGNGTQPPYALEPYILAWDVVDHDHLDRAARLNTDAEAGFLDFQELAATTLAGAPPTPERDPRDAPTDAGGFAAWLGRPAPAPTRDELTEAVRWYMLAPDLIDDDAHWQQLLDDPETEDLELKLSRQQAETVFAPGPLLLAGTAGSGKTTVSVYRLARAVHETPTAKVLYVTYSAALLATVRQLFEDLHRARGLPPPLHAPEFRTFPQLWRRFATDARRRQPLIRYAAFAQWYRAIFARDDADLAWEEIRGIIKGACLDPHAECLDLAAYEDLGRKRAPYFAGERPRLHRVYTRYQAWLAQTAHLDDIDLARLAWRGWQGRDRGQYDVVICDEGQDLTELEMEVLLALCAEPAGLFFTADPQQIVNPSGFRWAELRSRLRARQPALARTPIERLDRNYRSVGPIVSLANALVELQRRRTGRSDDDEPQEASLEGPSPLLVQGEEAEVLAHLRDFGPRCAVIAADPMAAERLGRQLGTERVFDPASAKGLEFDAVVLWQPLAAAPAAWTALLAEDVDLREDPVSRRLIRHLYVGVTRARRFLAVYEADPALAALWQREPLRGHLESDSAAALDRFLLHAATPEAWAREGAYFMDRDRFRQAAECYRRAGDEEQAALAIARWHESLADYHEAARLFAELALPADRARCLAAAGEHAEAGALYRDLADWEAAADCFVSAAAWEAAAEAYLRLNRTDDHRRCLRVHYEATANWLDAARIAMKQGDHLAAATLYDRAGHPDRAAEIRESDTEE